VPEKPSHAVIWVAKTYPQWQSLILTTLKALYEVSCQVVCYLIQQQTLISVVMLGCQACRQEVMVELQSSSYYLDG